MSKNNNIECSSVVSRVVVHARGALVTREVLLPQDLPSGVVDVDVPGITLQAEAGSARAALEESERVVASVHSEVVIPKGDVKRGPTVLLVRELSAKIARINDELRVLNERRKRLVDLSIEPMIRTHDRTKRERDPFDQRFADALEMASLVNEKTGALDERVVELEAKHRKLNRELEAARLEDLQTSSRERMGESHPQRTITTRLVGEGRPGKLLVTYAISAARWWPTYTLRVEEKNGAGLRANWTFEAIVAQKSGEDWSAVQLALSSADLIFDARLPELHSLRFGRAQPPRRRPFRPAPQGIDEMFAAYLSFGGRAFGDPPLRHALPTSTVSSTRQIDILPQDGGEEQEEEELDEDTAVNLAGLSAPMDDGNAAPYEKSKSDELMMLRRRRLGAASTTRGAPGGAPPPPQQPGPTAIAMPMSIPLGGAPMMPMPEQQALAKRGGGLLGAIGGAVSGAAGGMGRMADKSMRFESGMLSEEPAYPEEAEELAPSDVWTNYDMLVLAHADHGSKRGRLVPNVSMMAHDGAAETRRAIQSVNEAADARFRDPLESRGMFDHRYEADGRADIPSDGRVHRMTVAQSPCTVKLAWRTVPSETEEVFREAHVTNPFDTGLLGGPVDVYLDGSLLASTMIDRIDRGGTLFCGMGVDDRVKVARNVRASEESAGLLGGSIAVTHVVDIELSSTIRDPIKVTVLERVPVTDDKAIEVKIVRATPLPDVYDQADRGAPVRGGSRFEVSVSPGKKTSVEVVYRLVFAQKLDIVGGSRRG